MGETLESERGELELTEEQQEIIYQKAQEILRKNTKGDFIMPDAGYYEGAWLWDTGFIELGEAHFEPEKAAERLSNWLKGAQWKNGFLPHILFFAPKTERYFPGPEYWQTEKSKNKPEAPTSGITQPPVLGFACLRTYENLKQIDGSKALTFLCDVYPRLLDFHRYLFRERDPEGSGLVSIYHPWEAGLDNSPRWEEPLSRMPVTAEQLEGIKGLRKDVRGLTEKLRNEGMEEEVARKLAAEMRPTDEDYARYLDLVRFMSERGYEDKKIYPDIPFNVKDVLFNSVLYASNEALLIMVYELREQAAEVEKARLESEIDELRGYLKKQAEGLKTLYDEETGLYYDLDIKKGRLIKRKTIASFVPLFTLAPTVEQSQRMVEIAKGPDFRGKNALFLIPSTARTDPSFHEKAYWRGPVWLPTSWLVLRGFERVGLAAEAEEMRKSLLRLVFEKGFYEYYNPDTNEGLGREDFSWTASLAIDLSKEPNFWKKLWRVG